MTSAPFAIIDIGPSQGVLDAARIAASTSPKIDAVYLKATEGASGAGSSVPAFAENAAALTAAGVPWGAYHFLSPFSPADAQVEHFLATIKGSGYGLPPMVDVERSVGAAGRMPAVSDLLDFLAAVEAELDVVCLIYTADWVSGPMGLARHPELRSRPLWVPAYQGSDPPVCPPWGAWSDPDGGVLGWQDTAKAVVPGVRAVCDMSRFKAVPTWVCLSDTAQPSDE